MNGDGSASAAKRYTCSKLKLDSLFVQFFSLPETQQTVRNIATAGAGSAAMVALAIDGGVPRRCVFGNPPAGCSRHFLRSDRTGAAPARRCEGRAAGGADGGHPAGRRGQPIRRHGQWRAARTLHAPLTCGLS
jgi:hypothetical protein